MALGAHLEVRHRGRGPVIGYRVSYSEPWTAIGAVGERVSVALLRGIEEFFETVLAGSDVWGDQGPPLGSFPALLDPKLPLIKHRKRPPGHSFDHGQRRSLHLYLAQEEIQLLWSALRLDVDPLGVVADQPAKPVAPR